MQISLDVRGKRTLEESLDFYCQGELMEGDNQYFCEEAGKKVAAPWPPCICTAPHSAVAVGLDTCPVLRSHKRAGQFCTVGAAIETCCKSLMCCRPSACHSLRCLQVDAVKRNCLKVLPHTLVIHLKRFEFDYETMTRWKIKDRRAALHPAPCTETLPCRMPPLWHARAGFRPTSAATDVLTPASAQWPSAAGRCAPQVRVPPGAGHVQVHRGRPGGQEAAGAVAAGQRPLRRRRARPQRGPRAPRGRGARHAAGRQAAGRPARRSTSTA